MKSQTYQKQVSGNFQANPKQISCNCKAFALIKNYQCLITQLLLKEPCHVVKKFYIWSIWSTETSSKKLSDVQKKQKCLTISIFRANLRWYECLRIYMQEHKALYFPNLRKWEVLLEVYWFLWKKKSNRKTLRGSAAVQIFWNPNNYNGQA